MKVKPLKDVMLKWNSETIAANSKIPFEVFKDKQEIYEQFANEIVEIIKQNNDRGTQTKLILPVGPKAHYPILVELINSENISLKNTHIFMMDEYLDWQGRMISADHFLSFRGYIREILSEIKTELRLPENQLYVPDPCRIDDYSRKIQQLGGIDACFGGVGSHGHIAFNEPPNRELIRITEDEFLNSKTRIIHLAPETVVLNCIRAQGGFYGDFPTLAVTVGMADIRLSKKIRLCCDGGQWQRYVLRMALLAEPTIDYPITLLSDHQDIKIYTDEETIQAVLP